ncbi:uncharacterized protein LOC110735556 [Chenopodium quinoa]|uniref:uncharacterized protein LOC110735556 n=1 Tax=Chenopodium quinoa TaxID=63459 RepID=UPI000B76FCAC|nr:uncharacterized protein LOC110735556 [Chenopodium quinoa]
MNNWAMNVFNFDQRKRKLSRFSLDERLQGWTIKINPRPKDTTRTDRFFVHCGSGIQFRSKNEVDDFLHFGYHPKRQVNNVNGPVNVRRSTKRNINWRLYQRGVLPDGTTPIFDINFLEPGAKQKSNNIILIEGTTDPEIDKPCKKRKTIKLIDDKERAKAFLYEMHQPLQIKDKGDNDEEQDKDKDKDNYKDIGKGKGKMYED